MLDADDFFFDKKYEEQEKMFGTLEEMEKAMIEKSLKLQEGNLSAVAAQLGITRQTLYNKLKKYNL